MTTIVKPSSDRICFVIMPIADMAGYEAGHFSRVYEFIFKPAIIAAGLIPIRADEVRKTNYIVVDVLRKILESDIVLCDISGRNPNVLFELGIGQAFNRPVCIVKDDITERVFDIQGLRDTEFNTSLRIDTVRKAVAEISQSLRETLSPTEHDINSLVELLSIKPASLPSKKPLGEESSIILAAINGLSEKVLRLERDISRTVGEPTTDLVRIKRPKDSIEIRLGATLWNNKGQEVGTVTGIFTNHILLRNPQGGFVKIAYSSDEIDSLETSPF